MIPDDLLLQKQRIPFSTLSNSQAKSAKITWFTDQSQNLPKSPDSSPKNKASKSHGCQDHALIQLTTGAGAAGATAWLPLSAGGLALRPGDELVGLAVAQRSSQGGAVAEAEEKDQ